MTTTSLKLPDELKQRVAAAAKELGVSPHAFMVEAIRRTAEAVEQRSGFIAQALEARDEMRREGQGHYADDVRAYLRRRLQNGQATRPAKKPWRE